MLTLVGCKESVKVDDLKKFAATESFPDDVFLDTVQTKKALIIVAHDDDDCIMSGTIYKLKKAGWKIEQWSLLTTRLADGSSTHPAEIISMGNRAIVEDGHFRNKNPYDGARAPYLPIPKEHFAAVFETNRVKNILEKKINEFKPTVIFTMDNEIGGYGNPEHVFISQLIVDLFQENKIPAQRIYQGVVTNHMEEEIIIKYLSPKLKEWGFPNPYLMGKEVYKVSGIPEPTVEVNIKPYAEGKMQYLRSYSEDAKKNIRKFIPYYEDFDAKTYFTVFDREFFRVLENTKR